MHYIPPAPELADVDDRWHDLPLELQHRVVDLMLTVASIPMALAIDAVLEVDDEADRPPWLG